jgi:predicted transcriptional regulator
MQILSAIDTLLYPAKLIFAILGFKVTKHADVLDHPNRSSIYAYIQEKPGVHIGEIVDNIGLNRGTLRHHLKILESENMIEAQHDRGKVWYFQSNSTSEEEKQIILALQNEMIRKIICNVLEEECNTNKDLVQATGISKGTITWYMKQLKKLDFIEENKAGRDITYIINPAYQDIIKKHM